MALSLAALIDIVALIALPIFDANNDTTIVNRPVSDVRPTEFVIQSVTERLDARRLTTGSPGLVARGSLGLSDVAAGPPPHRAATCPAEAEGPCTSGRTARLRPRAQAVAESSLSSRSGGRGRGRPGGVEGRAVEDSTPSSATARSMPVWPIASRTSTSVIDTLKASNVDYSPCAIRPRPRRSPSSSSSMVERPMPSTMKARPAG